MAEHAVDKLAVCGDCHVEFLATRRTTKRCPSCRRAAAQAHANRPRPERYAQGGVGKGAYERKAREYPCKRCGAVTIAKRSDALCSDCHTLSEQSKFRTYEQRHKWACADCGRPTTRRSSKCRSCAKKGTVPGNYKGGRVKAGDYVAVRIPRGGAPYTLEHIAVWEAANGPVPPNTHIHHLNGVKSDNRLENLIALRHSEHPHWNRKPYEEQIRTLEARLRTAGLPIDDK